MAAQERSMSATAGALQSCRGLPVVDFAENGEWATMQKKKLPLRQTNSPVEDQETRGVPWRSLAQFLIYQLAPSTDERTADDGRDGQSPFATFRFAGYWPQDLPRAE